MKKIVLVIVLLQAMFLAKAQETDLEKYKSMFTLNFIRHIDWPEEARKGEFVIGVVNEKRVASYLKELSAGKKFGFQNIVIKEFNSIQEVSNCQVVYLGSAINLNKSKEILDTKIKTIKSLVISEREGSINSGSMINFVVREDKLKFEISQKNASLCGLVMGSSLTNLTNAILL